MLLQCFQHQSQNPIPFPPRVLRAQLQGDIRHCAWIPRLFPEAGKEVEGPRCRWSQAGGETLHGAAVRGITYRRQAHRVAWGSLLLHHMGGKI